MTPQSSNPAVQALIAAINANDREAFRAALTPDATMSDDGTDRDLDDWTEREIFSANGHMEIETQAQDGLSLVARFRNDTWGEMRTRWQFTVDGDKVSRFDTGQA
ncbi:nuclear transport factor 2 family protein [Streptomyces sp. T-3]|nr:nuclear transport factor 2 family protein [Streptomyces sp. T-3]